VGSGSTVTTATFSLYMAADYSATDFTVQARLFDWSTDGLTVADYRSGNPDDAGSLDEYTLLATKSTDPTWSTSAYTALTSESAFLTNVSKTGTTYLLINSDRHLAGNDPTGEEYMMLYYAEDATGGGGTDRDPKIYCEYTEAGATQTEAGAATATFAATATIGVNYAQTPITVWSGAADDGCRGYDLTYATARSTGAVYNAGAVAYTIGQRLLSSYYRCHEVFVQFDTSSIGADSTVTSATFSLYGQSDGTTTNEFVMEARIRDWGAALEDADWVAGANLGDYTLVAQYDTTGGWPVDTSYTDFSNVALPANIAKTGTTYIMVASDRQRTNNAPTGNEYANAYSANEAGTDRDPKIYIEYQSAAATRTEAGTGSYVFAATGAETLTKLEAGTAAAPLAAAGTIGRWSMTTDEATEITNTTATSGGLIDESGGLTVTDRGCCWNKTGLPTVADSHTHD